MKQLLFILSLFFITVSVHSQEYTIEEMTTLDMLEFKTERQAVAIQDKLWQVGVEVEVQEGVVDGVEWFYIELQDTVVLDIEIEQLNGTWQRWFPKNIRKKLVRINLDVE
jgi:hypothetical protein